MSTHDRIAILGGGNIGMAMADGLARNGRWLPAHITVTRRRGESLAPLNARGFAVTTDNGQAVRDSDLVVLAVQPGQLDALLADIKGDLQPERHVVVSVVSGASIAAIRSKLGSPVPIVRAMPNTAISIGESMTTLAADPGAEAALARARALFEPLGRTLVISESHIGPATALAACGVAFFLRAIRAASQGGIEIGFHPAEALLMAAQTARGAATLLLEGGTHPEAEIDRVTTPRGCTIAGLNQMEHQGFSSSLIQGIVLSAEKADQLYRLK
jgi:pyrroline-5-carboxylate reductase